MARIGVKGQTEPSERSLPKVGVRKATSTDENVAPSGPAIEQNRATQFGYGNDSDQTQGNKNYIAPGRAGGMT